MRTTRLVSVATAAVVAVMLATACTPDSTSEAEPTPSSTTDNGDVDLEPITVGLTYIPDIQFAPFYLAESLGYYQDAGLEVELRHHGASESLFAAIEEGQEQLVVASGDEVLAARAQGSSLVQAATLFDSSPVALIAPAGSAQSMTDLAGKTIGVPGEYGSTYLGLLMLLDQAEMTTDDVDIQSIGYTQTTALLTGQVDAVMGFRTSDAVRIADAGTEVLSMSPENLVSVGIALPEAELAEHPETVEAFISATLRGTQAAIDDPEEAVEIAAEYIPGMTQQAKDDALRVLEATNELWSTTGDTDPVQWQAMAEAMLAAGMIDAIPDGGFQN